MVLLLEDPLFNRDKGITTIWLLATLGSRSNYAKITKKEIENLDIPKTCTTLKNPRLNLSLRQSSSLLYGITLVYKQKTDYSFRDANQAKLLLKRQNKALQLMTNNIDLSAELQGFKPNLTVTLLRDDPDFYIDTTNPFGLNWDISPPDPKGFNDSINRFDYSATLGTESPSLTDPEAQITMIGNDDYFETRNDFNLDSDLDVVNQDINFVFGDDGEAVMLDDGYTRAPSAGNNKDQESADPTIAYENAAVLDAYDFGDSRVIEEFQEPIEEVPNTASKRRNRIGNNDSNHAHVAKKYPLLYDHEVRLRIGALKEARENYIELRNEERARKEARKDNPTGFDQVYNWFQKYQSILSPIQKLTVAKSFIDDFDMKSKVLDLMSKRDRTIPRVSPSNSSSIRHHRRSSSVASIEEARRAEVANSRRNSGFGNHENNFDVFMDQYDNDIGVAPEDEEDIYQFVGNDAILDITWERAENFGNSHIPNYDHNVDEVEEEEIEEHGAVGRLQKALALDKNALSSRPSTLNSDEPTRVKRRKLGRGRHGNDDSDEDILVERPSSAVSYYAFDNCRSKYIDRSARKFFSYIQTVSREVGNSLEYELEGDSNNDNSNMNIELTEITFEQIAPCQTENPVKRRFAAEAMQKILLLATRSMIQIELKPDLHSSKWGLQRSDNIGIILNAAEL